MKSTTMKILVTAGSTIIPIDQVRAITNIFKGKTGKNIANYLATRKEVDTNVTIITSNHSGIKKLPNLKSIFYRTYAELRDIMEREITTGNYDVIIHSAAVSDYSCSDVCVIDENGKICSLDVSAKISSKHKKLYLELSPTEKLIDCVRERWSFNGMLIKFKLEVGVKDEELLSIATQSVRASRADLIVANCLEWYGKKAYLVKPKGEFQEVSRRSLSSRLYERIMTEVL